MGALVLAALASPAEAQVYVGGAIAAEVVRTSSAKSGGTTYDNGSGEAFAGAIRVGTFLTERVGVELEYFRPGEIDSDAGGPIYLTDYSTTTFSFTDSLIGGGSAPSYPIVTWVLPSGRR